jgi:3-phenylpropionate/trans-cinnamate dioxygenase ferredoxin subunit
MAEWYDVAPVEEIPPGACRTVDLDGRPVAVINLDGEFYAIEDLCTHDGGDLASGDIEGDVIVCPRHGARFSIKTGEVLAPPAYEGVATFPVRVENGMVQVCDQPAG